MGRMHGDAQFAGSSSVPAHVEMMGLIGAGNNPMVGMTVASRCGRKPGVKPPAIHKTQRDRHVEGRSFCVWRAAGAKNAERGETAGEESKRPQVQRGTGAAPGPFGEYAVNRRLGGIITSAFLI